MYVHMGNFLTYGKEELGFAPLRLYFIPRAEGPRDEFFTSRGMKYSLKGATTQFFLTAGYENAFHTAILNNAIFREIV